MSYSSKLIKPKEGIVGLWFIASCLEAQLTPWTCDWHLKCSSSQWLMGLIFSSFCNISLPLKGRWAHYLLAAISDLSAPQASCPFPELVRGEAGIPDWANGAGLEKKRCQAELHKLVHIYVSLEMFSGEGGVTWHFKCPGKPKLPFLDTWTSDSNQRKLHGSHMLSYSWMTGYSNFLIHLSSFGFSNSPFLMAPQWAFGETAIGWSWW